MNLCFRLNNSKDKGVTRMATRISDEDVKGRKIINVSSKRQITIPLQFYRQLDLGSEIECLLEDGRIILQPLHRDPSEFSLEILKDLLAQGYAGDLLLEQFEKQSQAIKKAANQMLEEADAMATGRLPSASFDEVFGSED